MKKKIKKSEVDLLISTLYATRISGATLCHPNYFPDMLIDYNCRPRNYKLNVLLGTVITNPSNDKYVLGVSYYDLKEDKPNEDLFLIDRKDLSLTPYYRGEFETINSEYTNTHKGDKKFLLTPQKRVEILFKRIRYHLYNS